MTNIVEKHRRYLPHYQEKNRYYSLTWRLDGELPVQIKEKIREMQAVLEQIKSAGTLSINSRLLQDYDQAIKDYDEQLGKYRPTGIDLSDAQNGKVLCDAFHFYDKKLYDLHTFCVMPNHVHLLVRPFSEEDGIQVFVSDIVKRIKSFTSKEIGKLNGTSGKLWRGDYFDRQIRNERDYYYTVQYILNNPVKAGLVADQKEWKLSFCNRL